MNPLLPPMGHVWGDRLICRNGCSSTWHSHREKTLPCPKLDPVRRADQVCAAVEQGRSTGDISIEHGVSERRIRQIFRDRQDEIKRAAEPYRLTLEVRALPPMNISRDVHWSKRSRERKEWIVLMRAALGRKPKPPAPLQHASLRLVRRSNTISDYGNLVGSFKLVEDILQPASRNNPGGLGIIANDSMACIGQPHYQWEQVARMKGCILVEVDEVKADPPVEPCTEPQHSTGDSD